MFCIDASVFINAARKSEKHSDRSRQFLQQISSEKLSIFLPEIVIPEIMSGIMRSSKNEVLAENVVSAIRDLPNTIFVAISRNISDQAIKVIKETKLKSADAIYVALAINYNLTLVTLDKEQLSKGATLVSVMKP